MQSALLAPSCWPKALQEDWLRDANRLFARQGQATSIEAANVTSSGFELRSLTETQADLKSGTKVIRLRNEEELGKHITVREWS